MNKSGFGQLVGERVDEVSVDNDFCEKLAMCCTVCAKCQYALPPPRSSLNPVLFHVICSFHYSNLPLSYFLFQFVDGLSQSGMVINCPPFLIIFLDYFVELSFSRIFSSPFKFDESPGWPRGQDVAHFHRRRSVVGAAGGKDPAGRSSSQPAVKTNKRKYVSLSLVFFVCILADNAVG